jgi:hypothetical protein
MKLTIAYNETNYSSDSMRNGRIIKKFYKQLCLNVFKIAYRYSTYHFDITKEGECPLLFSERNIYSIFASAINNITPIHLSEWGFTQNNSISANTRRVDFYAMYKDGNCARPTNFYMELKNGWYCLNKKSKITMDDRIIKSIKKLVSQLRDIRLIKPAWNDFDDVYLGIVTIYGYYREKQEKYTRDHLYNEILSVIDRRIIKHLIVSTWTVPEDLPIQWENDRCRFISIIGLPISP